jgi:hypothetical protein
LRNLVDLSFHAPQLGTILAQLFPSHGPN